MNLKGFGQEGSGSFGTIEAGLQYHCVWVGRGIQPPSSTHINGKHLECLFSLFLTCVHRLIDQRTDQWRDNVSCKVALLKLERQVQLQKTLLVYQAYSKLPSNHSDMISWKYQVNFEPPCKKSHHLWPKLTLFVDWNKTMLRIWNALG